MIQEEGQGWRLARDPSRKNFPILIGGEGWALELTKDEWRSLVLLINDLLAQLQQLESQLMKEELISLEMERLPWWACVDGDRLAWSLKLIFQDHENRSRGFEVFWPIPSAQAFVAAMRTMWDCYQ